MNTFDDIGIQVPQVYLPKPGTDLTRWAVIACDQFTSQPEYWQQVERIVGEAPSTFRLILPEVQLEEPGVDGRIRSIQAAMRKYLDEGVLEPHEGLILVERSAAGRRRRGIVLSLDLERYDFARGSASLIRASEGTIIERLPPRVKVRQGAALELPHILVLIDDPDGTVIEPVAARSQEFSRLYDFDLMLDSGHLTGFALDEAAEQRIVDSLRALASPGAFAGRYGVGTDEAVLLFAMGDGNHSLATAKAVWESMKSKVGMNHPARYALVEIENIHDPGLEFEPIHRVLFGLRRDLAGALQDHFRGKLASRQVAASDEMVGLVDESGAPAHRLGLIQGGPAPTFGLIEIREPASNLPVGTLQGFLDRFMADGGAEGIDYVHGQDVVCRLGSRPGNAGFYVPGMEKSALFQTVILDGALPRKTFSMGEAREKRFYMECRKIA
jgi:hypothetical protein